jgi:dUTP pyrophosphatase
MEVKIKKLHKDAVIPAYATDGSAGMDIVATTKNHDDKGNIVYGTGLAFEIPKGYVGLLFPRSSNTKKDLVLLNSVGVLDSDYRGEVTFKYRNTINTINLLKSWWQKNILRKKELDLKVYSFTRNAYEVGDKIGQIIIVKHPYIEFEESETLSETMRGAGGYGSTGK